MTTHATLRNLLDQAALELEDALQEGRLTASEDASDVIHEIADSNVPVFDSDLLAIACDDNDMATDEPDCGPAFDGKPTPINIIAANIYEALTAHLWGKWEELKDAADATTPTETPA